MSFHAALHRLEKIYERLRGRDFEPDELAVECYTGYASQDTLHLRGRVVKYRLPRESSAEDSGRRNFLNIAANFFTKEAPATDLEVTFRGQSHRARTDDEGHFKVAVPHPGEQEEQHTDTYLASIVGTDKTFCGRVQLQTPDTRRIIISDIDDTVVETGAQKLWQMLKTTLFHNEHTRTVFPGVADFYRELLHGKTASERNLIYYISSSPWNLRTFLRRVFEVNSVPDGAAFLTDWGISKDTLFKSSHGKHKLAAIRHLRDIHAPLPIVLIGDSGEKDPEIYTQIARESPDRITAIYIRDVSAGTRDESVDTLADACRANGVSLLRIASSDDAIADARQRGLVSA